MGKRMISLGFILTLIVTFFASCASNTQQSRDASHASDPSLKTFNECVQQVDAAAQQIWPDRYFLESSDSRLTLSSWSGDVSNGLQKALKGSQAYEKSWDELTESFRELSSNVQDVFTQNGHNDVEAYVNILDEFAHDTLLYSARNGKTVYDPVGHIDIIGVNSAAGAEIAKSFSDLIDGAEIKSQADFDTATVSLKTAYTVDERPSDWTELSQRLVEQDESIESSRHLETTVESADGTILLTVFNGKVMYDYYATEPPVSESEPSPTRSAGRAYVLNTNTMKFHLPTCSSVEEIAVGNRQDFTGTREEIISMGYDPCGRCKP